MPHTDIKNTGWITGKVPPEWLPWWQLLRLDRPVGIWLLLLPAWWGIMLDEISLKNVGLMLVFAVGAIMMRGSGCIINDLLDRKLDAMVERTAARPLASGLIKPWQALVVLACLLVLSLLILINLNNLTIGLGVVSLLLVGLYPLMKRLIWFPQLFLGLTFNWGVLMGAAAANHLGLAAFLLYGAGVLWTFGYDTVYAAQDKKDDARIGIRSSALWLGGRAKHWVLVSYGLSFVLLLLVLLLKGTEHGVGWLGFVPLLLGFLFLFWQTWRLDWDSPALCLRYFRLMPIFGWMVLLAIFLGGI